MSAADARVLCIAVAPGELWAALGVAGRLEDLRLLRWVAASPVGSLHLGRIVALKPELPAALVDIGLARPAFLSAEDAGRKTGLAGLCTGEAVVVQLTKDARGDKAAGVTLRPCLPGRLVELRPRQPGVRVASGVAPAERARLVEILAAIAAPGEGLVAHAAAAGAAADALAAEVVELRARWEAALAASRQVRPPARLAVSEPPVATLLAASLAAAPDGIPPDRIVIDDRAAFAEARLWLTRHHPALAARLVLHGAAEPLFEQAGLAAEIDRLFAPRLALPGGGAIFIETTAAAAMIDVDSGGAPLLATNLEAARAAARQIRLRNLAGPIVIDFITMKRRGARARVRAALAEALAADPAGPELLGWTRLGHFELVRKRRHAPLAEILFERGEDGGSRKTALTVALEALRQVAREAAAAPGAGLALEVNPEVAALLVDGAAKEARRTLEERLGQPLAVIAAAARSREAFDIRRR